MPASRRSSNAAGTVGSVPQPADTPTGPTTRNRRLSNLGAAPPAALSAATEPDAALSESASRRRPAEIFQIQAMAPAPSQTTYQLVVNDDNQVELRDWPRKRLSEKWTRNARMNPTTTKISHQEYLNGGLEDQIKSIFGLSVYDQSISLVRAINEQRNGKPEGSAAGAR